MRACSFLLVAALVACKSSAPAAPPANTIASSPSEEPSAPPAAADPAPAPEPAPANGERPASVTDEMVVVADKLLTALESLGTELTAVGKDCAKSAATLRKHAKLMQPIAGEAKKFSDVNDPAAEQWFQNAYGPRIMASMGGLMTASQACANDPDFTAATEEFGKAMEM